MMRTMCWLRCPEVIDPAVNQLERPGAPRLVTGFCPRVFLGDKRWPEQIASLSGYAQRLRVLDYDVVPWISGIIARGLPPLPLGTGGPEAQRQWFAPETWERVAAAIRPEWDTFGLDLECYWSPDKPWYPSGSPCLPQREGYALAGAMRPLLDKLQRPLSSGWRTIYMSPSAEIMAGWILRAAAPGNRFIACDGKMMRVWDHVNVWGLEHGLPDRARGALGSGWYEYCPIIGAEVLRYPDVLDYLSRLEQSDEFIGAHRGLIGGVLLYPDPTKDHLIGTEEWP